MADYKNIKKAIRIVWMLPQDAGDIVTKEEKLWLVEFLKDDALPDEEEA